MFSSDIKLKKFLLFLGDVLLLVVSLWLTLLFRYGQSNSLVYHAVPFSMVYAIWLLILYIDGLYDFDFTKNRTALFNKILLSLSIGAVLAVTFFYFGKERLFTIRPQRVLLINLAVAFALLYSWRLFFYYFIQSPKFSNNILVIGVSGLSQDIIKKITQSPHLGFSLKAVLASQMFKDLVGEVEIFSDQNQLFAMCKKHNINTIVFSRTVEEDPDLLKNVVSLLPLNIMLYDVSNFYERITGKIPVDFIQHMWLLENLHEGSKRIYEMAKRAFDIFSSIFLLGIFFPLIPIISFAIKISSPGPILFKQIRIGKNGKKFMAVKFRSMHLDAEKTGPQWAQKNDLRVTPFGKYMRKIRIDEIPQLLNVLRGEMSLIGPRPERPEFVDELKKHIPFYEERLLVKPGLTGWAQVMGPSYGGSIDETLEKIQYDLFYIKNRSVGLDLSIALKTIKTMVSRQGQ